MILLVDVGNTRMKWAWWDGTCLSPGSAIVHQGAFKSTFEQAWPTSRVPVRIVVANVAGKTFREQMTSWTSEHWKKSPNFILAPLNGHGIRNNYRYPERLGVDRWAAIVAARRVSQGKPCCIADCGSAITLDAVDGDGNFRGGLIIPGISLMRAALWQGTNMLPAAKGTEAGLFARETESGISAGTLLGASVMVDQLAGRMAEELGGASLLITGGDAPAILPRTLLPFRHEPDLVLRGLAIIAEESM